MTPGFSLTKFEEASKSSSDDLSTALEEFVSEVSDVELSFKDLETILHLTVSSPHLDDTALSLLASLGSFDDARFVAMRCLLKAVEADRPRLLKLMTSLIKFLDSLELRSVNVTESKDADRDEENSPNLLSTLATDRYHPATNPKCHANLFEKLVLILAERVDDKSRRKLIVRSSGFIDKMHRPFLLGDFYAKCVKAGGPDAIYALQGVMKLIQVHNFEYPDFYTDVYALVTAENFSQKKICDHFAVILDIILSSGHTSQCTIASFLKKLARIALFSTPDVILLILSLIHNALVRHEACRVLIDKKAPAGSCESDPFNCERADPLSTNAINSSLWELAVLQKHWHPHVAKRAMSFSAPLVKIEDSILSITDESSLFALKHSCRNLPESQKLFKVTEARLNLEPPAMKDLIFVPFCQAKVE